MKMKYYRLSFENGNLLVYDDKEREALKVRGDRVDDFCYIIKPVISSRAPIAFYNEPDKSMDTLMFSPRPMTAVVPTAKLAFREAKGFLGKTILDDVQDGYRMDIFDTPYEELVKHLDDFVLIDIYNYTIPLTDMNGNFIPEAVRRDYGDILIRFNAASEDHCDVPAYAELVKDRQELWMEPCLIAKKAVDFIKDHGVYREVFFKPEYNHERRGGSGKMSITLKTPMSVRALRDALGDVRVGMPAFGQDPTLRL